MELQATHTILAWTAIVGSVTLTTLAAAVIDYCRVRRQALRNVGSAQFKGHGSK